jgi:hypothetical protein
LCSSSTGRNSQTFSTTLYFTGMSGALNPTWSSPNGLHSLETILHSLIPQWPNGPHSWQLEATAQILDRRKQLVVAACGEGKTALTYLHLLVIQKLLANPQIPRHGVDFPCDWKPVVLMVTPLTELGRSQVIIRGSSPIKKTLAYLAWFFPGS